MLFRSAVVIGLSLAASLSTPGTGFAQVGFDDTGLAKEVLENHIRPGYAAFVAKTGELKGTLEAACKAPDASHKDKVLGAFRETVLAWSRVEHLKFGPAIDANRAERIMFWPDRQRVGERQVQAILEKKDPTATTAADLQKKSAAAQGLPALETLMIAKSGEPWAATPEGQFACNYAAAIAENLAGMAKEIAAGWAAGGTFEEMWLKPSDKNPAYKDGRGTSDRKSTRLNSSHRT